MASLHRYDTLSHAMPDPNSSVRQAIARVLALYFLRHLETEVQKPDEVLCQFHPGQPVRAMTQEMLRQVRHEFAIPEENPLPDQNLFKTWREAGINAGYVTITYEETPYVDYNPLFLARLRNIRDGTPDRQQEIARVMKKGFESADFTKRYFSAVFFLDSENYLRELLRQTLRTDLPGYPEADEIILEQSRFYQRNLFLYFQSVLETALADRERLLHEILPEKVAAELQRNGSVEPVHFPDAAVLFTDFEAFSRHTEHLKPADVIHRLNAYFTEFDRISAAHGLEKIKTIGDSYMAVAGVPEIHAHPVRAACDAALEILEVSDRLSSEAGPDAWHIRIGIHAGPLVAGVIGRRKFSYDVWGATVNFASRMESSGAPGRINVSQEVHSRVEPLYRWEARGPQPVKRLGAAEMFFLLGPKA